MSLKSLALGEALSSVKKSDNLTQQANICIMPMDLKTGLRKKLPNHMASN